MKSIKSIKRKGKTITLKVFRKDQKEDIDLDNSKHVEVRHYFYINQRVHNVHTSC